MSRNPLIIVAVCCFAFASPVASALPGDELQEIDLSADSQVLDTPKGVLAYRGNVIVTFGGVEIRGDELEIRFADDELTRATIRGAPATFVQAHEGERAPTEAEAHELVYDVDAGEVRLRGAVRVRQAGNEFASEDLRYDLASERVVAAGESADSRIRVTIQPRQEPPEPEP